MSSHSRRAPAPSRRALPLVLTLLLIASAAANLVLAVRLFREDRAPAPPPEPTPELKPYAALGSFLAENNHIADLHWSPGQFDAFVHGVRSTYEGGGYPLDEDARALRDDINRRVQTMIEAERPDPVEDYFRMLREKEGVKKTASGLHYRITNEGTGRAPTMKDTVVVSWAARLPDGTSLDQLSQARERVRVSDLQPGLAEGVQLLTPGGKALIYVPPKLSFGDGPWPKGIPEGAPIAFFLELHEVVPAE